MIWRLINFSLFFVNHQIFAKLKCLWYNFKEINLSFKIKYMSSPEKNKNPETQETKEQLEAKKNDALEWKQKEAIHELKDKFDTYWLDWGNKENEKQRKALLDNPTFKQNVIGWVENEFKTRLNNVNDEKTKTEIQKSLDELDKMNKTWKLDEKQAMSLLTMLDEVNSIHWVENADNAQWWKDFQESQKNQEKTYNDLLKNATEKFKSILEWIDKKTLDSKKERIAQEAAEKEKDWLPDIESAYKSSSEKQKNSTEKTA